jgi:hypothetical protein
MASRLQNKEHLHLLDVREVIEYHTYNVGGANVPVIYPAAMHSPV